MQEMNPNHDYFENVRASSNSPGNSFVAYGQNDGTLYIVHRNSNTIIEKKEHFHNVLFLKLPQAIRHISWSPEGKYIAVLGNLLDLKLDEYHTDLYLYNLDTGLLGTNLNLQWSLSSSELMSEEFKLTGFYPDKIHWDTNSGKIELVVEAKTDINDDNSKIKEVEIDINSGKVNIL
ncbi:MAG: hypothetical protein ACOC1O_05405 [bacterium]